MITIKIVAHMHDPSRGVREPVVDTFVLLNVDPPEYIEEGKAAFDAFCAAYRNRQCGGEENQ